MEDFTKEQSAETAAESLVAQEKATSDIYTMPKEFYVAQKKEGSGKMMKIILIVVGVLAVFGVATGYVLFTQRDAGPSVSQETTETDIDTADTIPVSPVDNQTTVIDQTEEPEEITTSPTENAAISPLPDPLPKSLDLDNDGLTDIEESLLGIDPSVQDTDGDGFLDGAELSAGFDPSTAGVNLETSSLFTTFVNNEPTFTVRMPSSWNEVRPIGTNAAVRFNALNNDSIIFEVMDNSNNDPIDTWYASAFPDRSAQELSSRVIDTVQARESVRRRQVFVPLTDAVLVITYDVGGKKEIAYPGIWEFILKSILL